MTRSAVLRLGAWLLILCPACGPDDRPAPATQVADSAPVASDVGVLDTALADTTASDLLVDAGCRTDADCPPASDACHVARCLGTGVCVEQDLPSDTPCEDGNPCTVSDHCVAGQCQGTPKGCQCQTTADCAVYEDGNACNGTLVCNTSKFPYFTCDLDPATVVACPAGLDTDCTKNQCDPASGACAQKPVADGSACSDDNACTLEDQCVAGACQAGNVNTCICENNADCAVQEDGDLCNGTLYCDKSQQPGKCVVNPATVVTCPSVLDSACLQNTCVNLFNPQGKAYLIECKQVPVAAGKTCDDGDPCTEGDVCQAGACKPGTDTCACGADADCAKMEDGNACNGTMFCNKAVSQCQVNPATVVSCPSVDDTACSQNLCEPKTGQCTLQPVAEKKPCEDGDPCTVGETCQAGTCTAAADQCACGKDADCVAQDDGNLCNGTMFCNLASGGKCELNPATVVTCPSVDDTACLKNVCDPKVGKCGMQAVPDTTACDDGWVCSSGDHCQAGQCQPGTNVCVCKSDAECASKDDGDFCNGTMYCNKELPEPACQLNPATVVSCPSVDDTTCRKNTCQAKTGECAFVAINEGKPCDDGSVCSAGDLCTAGQCLPGKNVCECQNHADCKAKDDSDACNGVLYCDLAPLAKGGLPACKINPASVVVCPKLGAACLVNACNPGTGVCQPVAANNAAPCNDGDLCTTGDTCADGLCAGSKVVCDDGNPCTQDACEPAKGCVHTVAPCSDGNDCTTDVCDVQTGQCVLDAAAMEGKACGGDQDGCTVNDTCKAGVCKTGQPVACSLDGGPCEEAKCASQGPTSFQCVLTLKPAGAPCDDGDACTLGSQCQGKTCVPGAATELYQALYDPLVAGATGWFAATRPLGNGGALAAGGYQVQAPDGTPGVGWWLVRVAPGGAATANLALEPTSTVAETAVQAMASTPAGGAVLAGSIVSANADLQARLRWFDASGQAQASGDAGGAGTDEVPQALAVQADGTVWVAGYRKGAAEQPWLAKVAQSGQPLWQKVPVTAFAGRLLGVADRGDGTAFVAGWLQATSTSAQAGWLARVGADGQVLWQKALGTTGMQALTAVAQPAGGGALAVGWRGISGGHGPWFVRFDDAGNETWQRTPGSLLEPRALALAGERPVVAGRTGAAGDTSLWLTGLDGLGAVQWTGGPTTGGSTALAAIAIDAGDRLLGAGAAVQQGKSRGLLFRADAWGHADCAASGACIGKKTSDCADDAACTQDFCGAGGQCQQAPLSGIPCDYDDGCTVDGVCALGKCTAGKLDRLFVRNYAVASLAEAISVKRTPEGGFLMVGRRTDGKVVAVRTDEFGEPIGSATVSAVATGVPAGAAALPGGSFVTADHTGSPGSTEISLRRWSSTGAAIYDVNICTGKCAIDFFHAVDGEADGAIAWYTGYYTSDAKVSRYELASGKKIGAWGGVAVMNHAVTTPAGGVLVAGGDTNNAYYARLRHMVGSTGWTATMTTASTLTKPIQVWRTTVRSDGGSASVGLEGTGLNQAFLARHSSSGGLQFFRLLPGYVSWTPAAIRWRGDGVLVAGNQGGSATQPFFLGWYDVWGNLRRSTALSPPAGETWTPATRDSVILLPDGGVVAFARRTAASGGQFALVRANPWGHSTCAAAGVCKDKKPADCDPDGACTLDVCHASAGCAPLTYTCDDGEPCTIDSCSGGCKTTANPCDDGDACTVDSCTKGVGCKHVAGGC